MLELAQEVFNPGLDGVADLADLRKRRACRIVDLPVVVLLTGVERAGVSAAHGDDDIRGAHDFIGERLRVIDATGRGQFRSSLR